MTNREKLHEVFPRALFIYEKQDDKTCAIMCSDEWLDAEYTELNPNEPKTVLYSGDGYADGYMVYDMAECPNCGYEYEESDKDWELPFCPNCGQALNWESEDGWTIKVCAWKENGDPYKAEKE